MKIDNGLKSVNSDNPNNRLRLRSISITLIRILLATCIGLYIFSLSLLMSSAPIESQDMPAINRAIAKLEEKGFEREVFLLRRMTTFRSTDNWINSLTDKENAFAATNCPFGIITIYPDFYTKAQDDTERAMILLHEAQHLQGKDEPSTYEYVWRNRQKLGWTILSHGTTPTFVTIELQTRENAPQLFTCSANLWNDCTENLQAVQSPRFSVQTPAKRGDLAN